MASFQNNGQHPMEHLVKDSNKQIVFPGAFKLVALDKDQLRSINEIKNKNEWDACHPIVLSKDEIEYVV